MFAGRHPVAAGGAVLSGVAVVAIRLEAVAVLQALTGGQRSVRLARDWATRTSPLRSTIPELRRPALSARCASPEVWRALRARSTPVAIAPSLSTSFSALQRRVSRRTAP